MQIKFLAWEWFLCVFVRLLTLLYTHMYLLSYLQTVGLNPKYFTTTIPIDAIKLGAKARVNIKTTSSKTIIITPLVLVI